jgi:hypothetical protein
MEISMFDTPSAEFNSVAKRRDSRFVSVRFGAMRRSLAGRLRKFETEASEGPDNRLRISRFGQERPVDIGVQIADNQSSPLGVQSRRLAQRSRRHRQLCPRDVSNPGKIFLKNTLILVALSGLLGVPVTHAQSSTILIGLREVYWRYVADPSGEAGFRDMGHCRRFGLIGAEDFDPFRYPFFLPESGSISSTDVRFGAMATMYVQQGSSGRVRPAFPTLPLPACNKNESLI